MIDAIDAQLGPHFFPESEDGADPRLCPACNSGRLGLRLGRHGAFIGCSNYPECRYTRPFGPPGVEDGDEIGPDGKVLGEDAGDLIRVMKGRFGPYVQRGEVTDEQPKPPRASLPKGWDAAEIDLEKALMLLSLPREVGPHPDDGEMIEAGIGRYGPYVKHGRVYANLPEVDEVFTIGLNRAVDAIAQKNSRGAGRVAAAPIKELGEHPERGGAVNVMSGRYGPYVKWDKVNATIPKGTEPGDVTMDIAVQLIAEREAKGGKKTARRKKAS